jgi:protein-L-isoaspartate O-methyltransferase
MTKIILNATRIVELLAAKYFSIYRVISLYYKKLVKKEVDLADIKPTDRVLCIGGGPCPISGILLHEYTGARVTIIDRDEACVQASAELVRKLGYDGVIEIFHGDAKDFSPEKYTVIHMAAQVCPLDQVFCNLKNGCRFGAKILVRLPKKKLEKFYFIKDRSVFKSCCGRAVHRWRNVGSTALFVKS